MSSTDDAAAWLVDEVGEGGVFTKEQLRAAFPGVTQIDRRVRDLRTRGWVIHTRREDPTLSRAEMRLVHIGGRTPLAQGIAAADRRRALLDSAYTCMLCGAEGGSTYRDARHVRVTLQVVEEGGMRIVSCLRCRANASEFLNDEPAELSAEVSSAAALSKEKWAAACRARIARRLLQR